MKRRRSLGRAGRERGVVMGSRSVGIAVGGVLLVVLVWKLGRIV